MTENEAIERLQTLNIILTDKAGHEEDGIEKIFTFSDITAICTAIQALEEIQQYRAIGTPTQIYEKIGGLDVELGKYHAIGTIEELQELKEKSVAKKPIDKIMYLECPTCGDVGILDCEYCTACGQKLDWKFPEPYQPKEGDT